MAFVFTYGDNVRLKAFFIAFAIFYLEGNKMRRNVKNDKVLRAITIGLAAMIAATSAPVTVLADETANGGGR